MSVHVQLTNSHIYCRINMLFIHSIDLYIRTDSDFCKTLISISKLRLSSQGKLSSHSCFCARNITEGRCSLAMFDITRCLSNKMIDAYHARQQFFLVLVCLHFSIVFRHAKVKIYFFVKCHLILGQIDHQRSMLLRYILKEITRLLQARLYDKFKQNQISYEGDTYLKAYSFIGIQKVVLGQSYPTF